MQPCRLITDKIKELHKENSPPNNTSELCRLKVKSKSEIYLLLHCNGRMGRLTGKSYCSAVQVHKLSPERQDVGKRLSVVW